MKVTSHAEAKEYIKRALVWNGVSLTENFDALQLPNWLEAYDEIEPLDEPEVALVIEIIKLSLIVGEFDGGTNVA
jgi:hypothetical protein